jgi:hypothetical protein
MTDVVRPLFTKVGLCVNEEKGQLLPAQSVEYLGMQLNLVEEKISITTCKKGIVNRALKKLIASFHHGRAQIPIRKLASILRGRTWEGSVMLNQEAEVL